MAGLGLAEWPTLPDRLEFHRCGPRSGRCEDVSVVLDFMIHDLDLAALCGARAPVAAEACGGEHEVAATIRYANGVTASFLASRQSAERKRGMTAFFADGDIEVDFLTREVRGALAGNKLDHATGSEAALWLDDPLGASMAAFLLATTGATENLIDGRIGRDALDAALMVEKARLALGARAKKGEYSRL
jgi:predicted dehydrogenase